MVNSFKRRVAARASSALVASVALVAGGVAAASTASASPTAVQYVNGEPTHFCMGVSKNIMKAGQPIIQWDCGSQSKTPDQYWTPPPAPNGQSMPYDAGLIMIVNQEQTSFCLSITGRSPSDGVQLDIDTCNASDPYQWWDVYYPNGANSAFKLRNLGSGYTAGITHGYTDHGEPVIQWDNQDGVANQQWTSQG